MLNNVTLNQKQMAIHQLLLIIGILGGAQIVLSQQPGNILVPGKTLSDGQTLISPGGTFQLGFFSPVGSTSRYLGISYYNIPEHNVVWVANRQIPINSYNGTLSLTPDGSLALSNGTHIVWWTNNSSSFNPVLQLEDSGNLVLTGGSSKAVIWQSFDYPSDTMLPGMKIGFDYRTNLSRFLTSWTTASNPFPGNYYWKIQVVGVPEMLIFLDDAKTFRTGPWNGQGWSGRPDMGSNDVFLFEFISNENETYYTFKTINTSLISRAVITDNLLVRYLWSESIHDWSSFWKVPEDTCDGYGYCGGNGVCVPNYSLNCNCLPGFIPKSDTNWNVLRQYHDGCVRRIGLDCMTDRFREYKNVKLPDTQNASVDSSKTIEQCRDWCLKDCSCMAFAVIETTGCIIWPGDLLDIRSFTEGADDLYIRLAAAEFSSSKKIILIIIIPALSGFLVVAFVVILLRRCQGITKRSFMKVHDLPVFDLQTLKAATNNFSADNKLGEGGFGPVYKGKFNDGQEFAVKKLSKYCLQGPEEFRNELLTVNKLQHRNLVRLLGCCIEGDERMLIYEYMENKSLDTFIFDRRRSGLLNWKKRVEIILGIARGLLYLQQGSRVSIIHRDLKPPNILLDKMMEPKISDFGIARIVEGDQSLQEPATRVVGTIGYIAPEYAMQGLFSFQSDVYSFGVVILEVLSGRKNSSVRSGELKLVGHVWELWHEGRELEVLDASVAGSYSASELSRCIQVSLLCVQDQSEDRPTIEEVYSMLTNASISLPRPQRPSLSISTPARGRDSPSTNEVTISIVEGR